MEHKSASMKTPLGRVRGLGSGRSGTEHFWHQRLTSLAGIPLTAAFLVILLALLGRNHAATVQILGSPLVAVLMLAFIVTTVYHMCLGMQEIIVDYVHDDLLKYLALMANTCFGFAVGLTSAYAILKLSFGV
jgi:succinate dehydrogenase membrane anchor subunit